MTTKEKIEFKITNYGDAGIMLVRENWYNPPVPGLPPSYSQVILMDKEEINLLMYTLGSYADKR
jgi:hypothetical protein